MSMLTATKPGMKQRFGRLLPARLQRLRTELDESMALRRIPKQSCDAGVLADGAGIMLNEIFRSPHYEKAWLAVESKLASLAITDSANGVNPGDRRALYYLVQHLKPRAVLEVGTHIGASTVHLASSLKTLAQDGNERVRLVSVDIRNMNDGLARPWLSCGAAHSPREMVRRTGCDDFVEFIAESSLQYLSRCREQFDLIFLDGDHTAATVYREIPAALKVLRTGGCLVLHDYFPKLKPLWRDEVVICGPYLAAARLTNEGTRFTVLPLGAIPWATKLGSRNTSLALVVANESA
jgi:predicted O-methyltransferase YrrM